MNATRVNICQVCFAISDQCTHQAVVERCYQCDICLEVYPFFETAQNCCKSLLNNEVLDSRHYAKEAKKVREPKMEYPTALLKGIR